ncbi:uncharacterized protein VTP21DRAFT_4143 [Calcarisporiella thermophila]|uniref:uncharacterized protein n=1 Tax=Calcarisporiella thermophila TaxID=911321 RepID=UPI0037423E4D
MSFPEGYFFIRNVYSGQVLDVKDGSTQEGASIILWNRKALLNDNQLWKYDDGFLINKKSGLVLEVKGASGGGSIRPDSELVQGKRREPPTNINQLWAYNYDYIMPYDPKVCISAQGDNIKPGTKIVADVLIDFPNNPKQQWMFDIE